LSRFVVDASLVLAWLLPDESSTATDALFRSLASGAAADAPPLLKYEVSNALLSAFKRRQRISREDCFSRLRDFDGLPIRFDTESPAYATTTTAKLAEDHGLTIYDAAYLELAVRKRLPLATLDRNLKSAAATMDVEVL